VDWESLANGVATGAGNRRVFRAWSAREAPGWCVDRHRLPAVSGKAMPERVRRHMLLDTGMFSRVGDSVPDDLLRDGTSGSPVLHCAWK